MRSKPSKLIAAPVTRSPTFLTTGILSPVIKDSSTCDEPSITIPSTGIFSPARTTIRSPTMTFSKGTSRSSFFTRLRAVEERSFCNPRMAADSPAGWPDSSLRTGSAILADRWGGARCLERDASSSQHGGGTPRHLDFKLERLFATRSETVASSKPAPLDLRTEALADEYVNVSGFPTRPRAV